MARRILHADSLVADWGCVSGQKPGVVARVTSEKRFARDAQAYPAIPQRLAAP